MRPVILLAAVGPILGSLFAPSELRSQEGFPHDRHSVFFSECSACHSGISSGAPGEGYPDISTCAACHDGTTAPQISWQRPEPRASNLRFPHETHDFGCAFCHQPGGPEDFTNIAFPEPSLCLGCHAPDASGHLEADGSCQICHVPVGQSRLDPSTSPDFPAPASHQASDFQVAHGPLAAASAGDCSICHDRSSCLTCHGGATHLPDAVLALPGPAEDGPKGVQLSRGRTAGFHPEDFVSSHAAEAATRRLDCTSCHSEDTCLNCHDGARSPSFHPLNFLASHGPEAYGRMSDCTSCHSSEAFCRECHLNLGFRGQGQLVAPFHDNQALWVLSHPQAARQDLESCVSCHQQADCLRCHSATSGLRVNPHGPDFDPSRIADRNQGICIVCHLSGGGGGI
jgi:hypothetical protein